MELVRFKESIIFQLKNGGSRWFFLLMREEFNKNMLFEFIMIGGYGKAIFQSKHIQTSGV